jgi:hypothetical protein
MDIITQEQVDKAMRNFVPQSVRRFIQFKVIGRYNKDGYQELCRLVAKDLNKQIELSENTIVAQSIAIGTKVTFNLKSRATGWHGDRKQIIETLYKGLKGNEDIDCEIHSLSHHTELGVKDLEYYDLKFVSGLILPAVSGFFIDIKKGFQGTGGEDESLKDY